MRLSIEHRTTYRFSIPQARLVQMLRMTPENTHDQTVTCWRIDVDCDANLRRHRDGFGNCTTMLYVEGPVDAIEIAVTGEVVTSHSDGVLHGTHEPLPHGLFLRGTPLTEADAAIAAFAQDIGARGSALDRLPRLNGALNARFVLDRGAPEPGLTAAEAFARDTATPRDFAQMFVAAARALRSPARYVTGYCGGIFEDDHRPTPHGWADAWVEGIGWIGFDPTFALSPEANHVRMAIGLDSAGAAPVAGSRLGEGRETMDVDLTVQRED